MSVFVCLHIHTNKRARARLYVYVGVGITVYIFKLIFKGKSDYSWWHVYKAYTHNADCLVVHTVTTV